MKIACLWDVSYHLFDEFFQCICGLPKWSLHIIVKPRSKAIAQLFQCVSLFHSAWTVPEYFLLGFLSLKLDLPLLSQAVLSSAWCHNPEPTASLYCSCGVCFGWPCGAWHGKLSAPALQCVPQSLTGCAFFCMETSLQAEEEGRRSRAQLLSPLHWASLGSSAGGLVMVAPGEHRGIALRKTARDRFNRNWIGRECSRGKGMDIK